MINTILNTILESMVRMQYSYMKIPLIEELNLLMKKQEFESLNYFDKEEAVWKEGKFILNYDEGNKLCDVYELFNFYVSFCYELDNHEKAHISAFFYPDSIPLLLGTINYN